MLIDLLQKIFDFNYNLSCLIANIFVKPKALDPNYWVGHRGVFNHPIHKENTLAAFELCDRFKTCIELDIHLSNDDQLIVHHDTNAKRVFSKALNIQETNFEDIRLFEPLIPLLAEALTSCPQVPHFFIELKTQLNSCKNELLVSKCIDLIQQLGITNKVTLISLDPHIIDHLNGHTLEVQNAIVYIVNNRHATELCSKNKNTGLLGWHFNFPFDDARLKNKLLGIGSINYKASSLWISHNKPKCYYFSNRIDYLFAKEK